MINEKLLIAGSVAVWIQHLRDATQIADTLVSVLRHVTQRVPSMCLACIAEGIENINVLSDTFAIAAGNLKIFLFDIKNNNAFLIVEQGRNIAAPTPFA